MNIEILLAKSMSSVPCVSSPTPFEYFPEISLSLTLDKFELISFHVKFKILRFNYNICYVFGYMNSYAMY